MLFVAIWIWIVWPQITTTWIWISAWVHLKGVSCLTPLHYNWRLLGPFNPSCAQKWPYNINSHTHALGCGLKYSWYFHLWDVFLVRRGGWDQPQQCIPFQVWPMSLLNKTTTHRILICRMVIIHLYSGYARLIGRGQWSNTRLHRWWSEMTIKPHVL